MFNLQKLTRTFGNTVIILRRTLSNQTSPTFVKILEKSDIKTDNIENKNVTSAQQFSRPKSK